MQRLFRVAAALVAMFFVISGMRFAPAAAAAQSDGVTSDTSYTSPTFGYELEWESGWEVQPDGASTSDSGDYLYLFNDEYGSAVTLTSVASQGTSPDTFLENYKGYLEENYGDVTYQDFETADPDYPALIATYDIDGTSIDEYAQVSEYDDALILTSVRTSGGLGLIAAALVSVDFTLDGDSLLPSFGNSDEPVEDDTPTPEDDDVTPTPEDDNNDRPVSRDETPEARGGNDDLEDYEAPTYGVTLSYDSELWNEEENTPAEDNDGRDLLLLESLDEDVPARVYFETYDSTTRATECFDTAVTESVGDIDDAQPIEDRNGDPIEGSSRGVKFGAYTFETADGDALAAYIECRALPGGDGVFAITLLTVEDSYDDAYDSLSDILDTVSLDGSGNVDEPEDDPIPTEEPEEDETPTPENDRPSSSADYESPTYGFTIDYGRSWDAGDETSEDGIDQIVLTGPDEITLIVQGVPANRGETSEECVTSYAESLGTTLEVDLVQMTNSDTDEPIAGEDDFGNFGLYGYENGGETRGVYLECGQSSDEEYFVVFIAEFPIDSLSTAIDEVTPIIESTDF